MPVSRSHRRTATGLLCAAVALAALAPPAKTQTLAHGGAGLSLHDGAALATQSAARNAGPLASVARARAAFGTSIAVDGNQLFVGRPGDVALFPMPLHREGSVHVFELGDDGEWTWADRIAEETAATGAGYGTALAASGGVLVVGAPQEGPGAVYVYGGEGASGAESIASGQAGQRLEWSGAEADAQFGAAVATNGTTILVGAPGAGGGNGAVVWFDRTESGEWMEAGVVEGTGDAFGSAIAVGGGLAVVGAPGPSIFAQAGMPQAGSARVFRWADGGWMHAGDLAPPSPLPALMGSAVAIADGLVFVGAPMGEQFEGGVYVFAEEDGEWTLDSTIQPSAPASGSMFGMALAADGADVIVGAPVAKGQFGEAFAFRRDAAGEWSETAAFGPGAQFYFYGMAVAMQEDFAFLGAPGAGFFEGTGFVFRRSAGGWEPRGEIVDEGEETAAVTGGELECEDGAVAGFDCNEVDLVSFMPVGAIGGGRGMVANDLWGWTDPQTGKEYAVIGRADATAFVDLGDPANPVFLGELPHADGGTASLWRDVKVYANHAFIVSDNAGAHGMQVFDLTQLRDVASPPVVFEQTAHYDGIHSAHNVVINEATGFAYAVGSSGGGETCGGGLHMIDVRDPANPTFAGCFSDEGTGRSGTGYSHDAQCVEYQGPDEEHRGREICLGANETALSIADVTDKENPVSLSTASYPNIGYVHQGWLTDDHGYFYVNDELDELGGEVSRTRTLVWDVRDLDDPVLVKEHFGTTASSDHNLYVLGDFMYQANYTSGLRILDISNPEEPEEVGYFDTVSQGEDGPGFAGAWSVYPYFESGILIVSSMKEGLFVLRKSPPRVS